MKPFFDTWHDFLNMGGYGFFVWLSYGIFLLCILIFIGSSIFEKRQIKRDVQKNIARERQLKNRKMRRQS